MKIILLILGIITIAVKYNVSKKINVLAIFLTDFWFVGAFELNDSYSGISQVQNSISNKCKNKLTTIERLMLYNALNRRIKRYLMSEWHIQINHKYNAEGILLDALYDADIKYFQCFFVYKSFSTIDMNNKLTLCYGDNILLEKGIKVVIKELQEARKNSKYEEYLENLFTIQKD